MHPEPVSIEMTTIPAPAAAPANPEPPASTNLCGRTFKDWTQYPSTCCGASNGALAVAFLIVAIVATIAVTDTNTKIVLMAGGFSLSFFFGLSAGAQCLSCWRVRQLKPERDLEAQVNLFQTRCGDLESENQKLQSNGADLTQALEKLKAERASQAQLTDQTQKILEDKTAQLGAIQKQLAESQQRLSQVEQAFEEFKRKTDETKAEIIKLAQHSEELRKRLQELGLITGSLEKEDNIWDENYTQISGEVDEFTKQNLRLAALQAELKKQVELMGQFLGSISLVAQRIRESTAKLDETDDKLLAASKNLEAVVAEKARQQKTLESIQHRYDEQKRVLGVLKESLLHIDQGKGQFAEVIRLIDNAIK